MNPVNNNLLAGELAPRVLGDRHTVRVRLSYSEDVVGVRDVPVAGGSSHGTAQLL